MSSASSPLLQSPTKDNAATTATFASTDALAYPSPSHSPATTYQSSMQSISPSIFNRRRSSVKALLKSANPPASPLDALVMALEATVEEEEDEEDEEEHHEGNLLGKEASMEEALPIEDEDPDATIPSSPTLFMKRPATNSSSLHHLPTMYLPEAAVSAAAQSPNNTAASGLTPSTLPKEGVASMSSSSSQQGINNRKMSISSQGSSSSAQSNGSAGERTKEYGCTIGNCEKKFYQVAHLRSHERCHSGTRPYICRFDGCDRAFTQLGNLKTHERKHTGERPYKCPHPDCDKTFTQLGNLKTHERIHDEVKPFMCRLPGCGKTFSQLGNLKTHTAKMHPDVTISDDELSIRTTPGTVGGEHHHHLQQQQYGHGHGEMPANGGSGDGGGARLIPSKEPGVVQVIAHFNPYQRRPIQPQQSEEERLLRKIRAMIHHQQRVRELEDGSEVSDEMDE